MPLRRLVVGPAWLIELGFLAGCVGSCIELCVVDNACHCSASELKVACLCRLRPLSIRATETGRVPEKGPHQFTQQMLGNFDRCIPKPSRYASFRLWNRTDLNGQGAVVEQLQRRPVQVGCNLEKSCACRVPGLDLI